MAELSRHKESLEELEYLTAEGKLEKTEKLTETLFMCPPESRDRAERALFGQVALAKKCTGKENKSGWLKSLAKKLNSVGLQSRDWISDNIYPLPRVTKVSKDPEGPSRDIRLKSDPTIQRTGEHLSEIDEDALLASSNGEEVMEVDPSGGSPSLSVPEQLRPSKPVSPVKPICKEGGTERAQPPAPRTEGATEERTRPPLKKGRSKTSEGHSGQGPSGSLNRGHPEARGRQGSDVRSESRHHVDTSGTSHPERHEQRRSDDSRGHRRADRSERERRDSSRGHRSRRNSDRSERERLDPSRGQHSRERPVHNRPHHSEGASRQRGQGYSQPSGRGRGGRYTAPAGRGETAAAPKRGSTEVVQLEPKRSRPAWHEFACPVRGCSGPSTRDHSFQEHLPLLFHPALKGSEVANRRRTALTMLQRMLIGAHRTLEDLVTMAESVGARVSEEAVDRDLQQGMQEFCIAVGTQAPESFRLRDTGNGVHSLLHWSRLLTLVSLLKPEEQATLRRLFEPSPEEEQMLPRAACGIDSHCHLDRTMARVGIQEKSLKRICEKEAVKGGLQVQVGRVVGVFCDPETHPSRDNLKLWASQGVIAAAGWHPRKLTGTEEEWQYFSHLVSYPEVHAIGEVGLDRTEPPHTWYVQMLNLERALSLLGQNHVLVLHCRSLGNTSDEAWLTVMHLMKSMPVVGRERLIHCHCFSGTRGLAERWLQEFPNTYFGFTSMVRLFKEPEDSGKLECIRWLESSRILLETDAPYFASRGHKHSTPAHLGYVAEDLGRVRQQPWQEVLQVATRNAERLYCPPPTTGGGSP